VPYKVQLRPEGEKGKCQYASQTQSTGSCQKPPNSGIEIRMRAQVRESFERVSPWRYCQHQRRKPNYIDCRLIASQSARRLSAVFTQPLLAVVHYGRDDHQTRVTRRVSVAGKRSFCDSLFLLQRPSLLSAAPFQLRRHFCRWALCVHTSNAASNAYHCP